MSSSLYDVVKRAWIRARALPPVPLDLDPREAAGMLAQVVFGDLCKELTVLHNVAGLALASRERLEVHEIRPAVARLIAATDLHTEPSSAPLLLERPFIVESDYAKREFLFGETWSIGCYQLISGSWYLVGLVGEGAYAVRWCPIWRGGDIALGLKTERSPLIKTEEHGDFEEWAREAARWVLIYSLLREADRSPIETVVHESRGKTRGKTRKPSDPESIVRVRVRVTDAVCSVLASDAVREAVSDPSKRDGVAALVRVCGHLKRQPYGEGGKLRKWVWVEGYQARRWLASAAVKTTVS